jgi:hypothetical protein
LKGRKRVLPFIRRVVIDTLSWSRAKCTMAPRLKVSSGSPAGDRSFRYCRSACLTFCFGEQILHFHRGDGDAIHESCYQIDGILVLGLY